VTPKPVLYGTIAARFAGTPAVVNAISGMGHVFAHNGDGMQILRGAVSAGYHLALRHKRMRLIFQNVDARADFLRRGWARADEAVLIRGSGVDVDAFRVAEPRPSRVPVVSLVSRMLWTKGVREFMEAAVQLRRDGVSARFVLVGDPDPGNPASVPGETLLDWARSGAVEWWGYRSDIPRVLRESDVACLPSYLEGLPKSLVEAAAAGLPIVATDVPGCREVVRDGENGFLVPLRDARALAAALRRLLEDRALRERLGATSRERAEREFTLDAVCEAHVQLYRALLD
jgi:glycosyltransferase involved in cell wall biosynthesis